MFLWKKIVIIIASYLVLMFSNFAYSVEIQKKYKDTFPKLFGMNIEKKNYHEVRYQKQLSKLDAVILGFYSTWNPSKIENPIEQVVQQIKKYNPNILVGQYTILNEAYDNRKNIANVDKRSILYEQDWWLLKETGEKVQWTSVYKAWDINISKWVRPDSNGDHYPQWLAKRDYHLYFEKVPEFDIWYVDNVMWRTRIKYADWNLDGVNDSRDDPIFASAFRQGHIAEWEQIEKLKPSILLMGNPDNDLSMPEYHNKLHGAFLEALMGKKWSLEKRGWNVMMNRYHDVMQNTTKPNLVAFNVWGDIQDYSFFRYAFASSLMDDGYFSFTDLNERYSSVPWFDEYDFELGLAIDPPQLAPWFEGVYRRRFENGVVFVNPSELDVYVPLSDKYYRLIGSQEPLVNNGELIENMVLKSKDGIVLTNVPVVILLSD